MSKFRRMAWCAAAAVAVAGSPASAQQAVAQQGGNIGTAANQTTGNTTSNSTTNTQSSSGTNGLSGATNGLPGASSTPQTNFSLATVKDAPSKTNTNNTAIDLSNKFRNSFGAVYYQGNDPLLVPNRIPGSFGTAIFPATRAAGGRGGGALTNPGGQIVTLPKQIAYSSQIQFKMPAGNPLPQLQSDLRGTIDRLPTNLLANPAGVQVAVDGRNVTLKGVVRDDEEARLVEGIVRTTPGVFAIKNELTFAK